MFVANNNNFDLPSCQAASMRALAVRDENDQPSSGGSGFVFAVPRPPTKGSLRRGGANSKRRAAFAEISVNSSADAVAEGKPRGPMSPGFPKGVLKWKGNGVRGNTAGASATTAAGHYDAASSKEGRGEGRRRRRAVRFAALPSRRGGRVLKSAVEKKAYRRRGDSPRPHRSLMWRTYDARFSMTQVTNLEQVRAMRLKDLDLEDDCSMVMQNLRI